jgi:5-methylcytosine-specific restriction endonuclease McrA
MALLNQSVLVLNRHWLAIHFCTVRRAIGLLYTGLARVVDDSFQTHSFEEWRELSAVRTDPEMIHAASFSLLVPHVIVLHSYARRPPQEVKFSRRNIFLRDHHRCQYCGRTPPREELTIDHVVPLSRGGRTTWDNVVLACVRCNSKKGSRLPEESGMRPRQLPKRPRWPVMLQRSSGQKPRSLWQRFVDDAYWNTLLREE